MYYNTISVYHESHGSLIRLNQVAPYFLAMSQDMFSSNLMIISKDYVSGCLNQQTTLDVVVKYLKCTFVP
jgi:hypothetical protein